MTFHFLYTIERLGKSQDLMSASYSAKEDYVFHNLSVEEEKMLKIIVIAYLTMIFNLLFISCLIYNRWMGDEMTKHGGRFDKSRGTF